MRALLGLEGQDHPLEADGKADAGRRPSTEQLGQPVVAPATAERLLLALGTGAVELPGGAGVVVEPAHQARLQLVGDAERVEVNANGGEVLGAGGTEPLDDARSVGVKGDQRFLLRVEEAERVRRDPPAVALGDERLAAAVEGGQLGDVAGPAGRIADRVEPGPYLGEADLGVEPGVQLDQLGVDGGSRVADRLRVPLVELAVAAGLRAIVAEHRTDGGEPNRLVPGLHPVLEVGAHDAGGVLGAERAHLVAARLEPEQLLLDDVRPLPEAALEDRRQLEERRLDGGVAVAARQVGGDRREPGPGGPLGGEDVAGAARGAEGGHGPKSSGSPTDRRLGRAPGCGLRRRSRRS